MRRAARRLWRRTWLPPLALALALAPAVTAAQAENGRKIAVEVVEVAAGRAYVTPGEDAGLRRGGSVILGARRYPILAASAASALIDLQGRTVAIGTRGSALVAPATAAEQERLPAPEPLEAYRGQWPRARLPADAQQPKPVPLGPIVGAERTRLALALGGAGVLPLSGSAPAVARGELRARLHYEPFRELPLHLDADAAAQLWFADNLDARAGSDSQPLVRVRQLEAAYGHERDLFAALGRLRYASRALGMLDGARLQAPLAAGFTLGAFGGFVPDPLDSSPSNEASRFGAELGWEDPALAVRPRVALTAHGSSFQGAIDERRLHGFLDLFPGPHRLSGHAELAIHGEGNPWNAPAQELQAAGTDVSFRIGELELGGRFDLQRPERSRWLAAFLPPEWLCITRPEPPAGAPEVCYGDEVRYLGGASASLHFQRVVLTAGASASTSDRAQSRQLGGFVGSRLRVAQELRIDTSLMLSTGSLLDTYAASLGVGTGLAGELVDVALRYRPAWNQYRADPSGFLEHAFGARIALASQGELGLTLDADVITGRDVDVLLLQTLLTWRPLGG